jgi:uncharacterized membrane protein (DUF373 family)
MADDDRNDSALVKLFSDLFGHIEHLVYAALGILLSIGAFLALAGSAVQLWHGLSDWSSTETIFTIVDRLLFVLLLIEVLHTVRASLRSGGLTCEPFLIVGLIASIRRVLVITLQTSEATKPGNFSADTQAIVHEAMVELVVIGGLILVLVASLYLLSRIPKKVTSED